MYIMKHGSSVLTAVSYSLILPLTVLAFASPWLGRFQEACTPSAVAGLVVVLAGFFIWRQGQAAREEEEEKALAPAVAEAAIQVMGSATRSPHGRSLSPELTSQGSLVSGAAGFSSEADHAEAGASRSEKILLLPQAALAKATKQLAPSSLPSFSSPMSAVVRLFSPAPQRRRSDSYGGDLGLPLPADSMLPSAYLPSGPEAASEWSDEDDPAGKRSDDDDDDGIGAMGFEERTVVLARAGWKAPRSRGSARARGRGRGHVHARSESSLRGVAPGTPQR